MAETRLLLTCEHGGHAVPPRLRPVFAGAEEQLRSHRGWDPGALALAQGMARSLDAPLLSGTISRLVVDLNRSIRHPRLFSELTRDLGRAERDRLLEEIYRPFRSAVAAALEDALARGPVLHLSVHSFTPILDGRERDVDVGLLYDPARRGERDLCRRWSAELRARLVGWRVRRNAPYRGITDGHCTALRRRHPEAMYRGVEIEVNQRVLTEGPSRRRVARALVTCLKAALVVSDDSKPEDSS